MFYFYDPTMILVYIGAMLSIWASANVRSVINKYQRVHSSTGLTAAEAARRILHANGIFDVNIRMIDHAPSDYYRPDKKELCLLSQNYNSTSVASIGIAAHECGHAIQDATFYFPLTIQKMLAPICAASSNLGVYILIFGMLLSSESLISLGIIMFAAGVGLSLLLLPIEYNASNRALAILESEKIMQGEELESAKKVLRAAGLTYVAAAAASVLSLLRLVLISDRRNRR